ncbi:MAG: Cobalt-zinc-cadmium resistance protein CzcA [Planctomycetes bacterium ADurb.Bin126]|nr:MAG: Cobalt-zinc-cadmium resistance protein CzcA [Planctomycetes bacterium ADurb.Bin126]HOD81510.1 efflux RND transporter permease subunit [Phycisphaerae bacterium]HQL74006.1 efflux RND transporter permease subunit [Phycisphaerae bacterium]
MSISGFSVHRPVFTVMTGLIVVILGIVSLTRLPIDLMPDVTYPTLTVSTKYENASPEEMEQLITRPIEEAVSAVPGAEQVTSISVEGTSNVRVRLAWGTDLDAAANDVRDRLDRVIPRLPEEADRPMLLKFDLANYPVLILGVSSKLDPVRLQRILEDEVKYRIERVPGVASLDIWGGRQREIHVNILPDKIKALNLPLDQVLEAVKAGNVNLPAGFINRGDLEVTIRTPGEYTSVQQVADLVVATRDGVPVTLREIAQVDDHWQQVRQIVRVNGEPGVRLAVRKQSGTNTVEVARGALAEIERVNREMPQIRIDTMIDSGDYIQRSIRNVGNSAVYGGALAIAVLLLFLRNLRSTFVIATAIPISIIATFALMYFGGFTLNIMTLGGLALGVGMLVDNAIVVLENIFRLRDQRLDLRQAAVAGSGEVAAAIISSTLTTLAVFLPLIFIRGVAGVLFQQMSLVVSFSLLCSLWVALTLVPMLASKVLQPSSSGPERMTLGRRLYRASGWLLEQLELAYRDLLHWALGHRIAVVLLSLAVLGGSVALIPRVGVELMPSSDENEVRANLEAEVGIQIGLFSQKMAQVEKLIRKAVPESRCMVVSIGGHGWHAAGVNEAEVRISLTPVSERTRSSEQIAGVLRKALGQLPGITVRTRAGTGLDMLRRMMSQGGEKIEVEVRGHDLATADELALQVQRVVEAVPGITDTKISRESGTPEEQVVVDRAKAADLKLTVSQIAGMLQTVLSGTEAGMYREGGDEYTILVKVKDPEKLSLEELLDLTITNSDHEPIVLRNVVNLHPRRGPVLIERKDQERMVVVSANLAGRDMGSVMKDIGDRIQTIPLPRDFALVFGGDWEEQQKAFRELLLSFVLALVLVYMVMACQFESLRDPFVVMFSVPLAVIGVTLALFLTGTTFNIQSFIGCIMLGGIVVNNAILLVDHTNLLRRRDGMPLRQAIEEAGRRRLRPILMTASTTVLGLLPLALGLGEGGEAQAPMARAVIGGLLSSTLITLVFVPVMYSLFERKLSKAEPVAEPVAAQPPPP